MNENLPVDQAVRAYLSVGRKYYATDAEIRVRRRTVSLYLNGRPHQRSWCCGGWRSPTAARNRSRRTLTIEHVLPQTPTPGWNAMLHDDLGPDENFAEVHESMVHTLGNLTLTGYNSELSNSSFGVKRVKLAGSGVAINQEIAKLARWGRPEIRERAARLAERVIDKWPGPIRPQARQSQRRAGTSSTERWPSFPPVPGPLTETSRP